MTPLLPILERMSPRPFSFLSPAESHRDLHFFALFRVLVACLLALLVFSPIGPMLAVFHLPMPLIVASVLYLLASASLFFMRLRSDRSVRWQVGAGAFLDVVIGSIVIFSTDGLANPVALLLLFTVAGASLFLNLRGTLALAALAGTVLWAQHVAGQLGWGSTARPLANATMFSVSYLAAALFCYLLAKQLRESQALAEQRGAEVANLSELNELIIRRMKTGVLVVDGSQRIRLANEAAQALLENASLRNQALADVSAPLNASLWSWRQGRGEVPKALRASENAPELLPRFVALSLSSQLFLIFLEDSRVYSGRAEELTLATLGRLSASIAHEIRNPLASISYSAQLLDESEHIPDTDRRLLEIIHSQCTRMNGIVQNILGLARRERSQPEILELRGFVHRFVDEYRNSHPLETDLLLASDDHRPHSVMVDAQQLHQVVTVLVHNALTYGRLPGQPAKVTLQVRGDEGSDQVLVEVIDRGPGIPPAVAERLFTPFFTTSEHGTGLGLYIAKQLCEANLCTLNHFAIAGGGCGFRISVPNARAWTRQRDAAEPVAG